MGFSTSAATAVMLIAFLAAASVLFPTLFTAGSGTGDAFAAQADQTREQANTALEVTNAQQDDYVEDDDTENGDLTVTLENQGSIALEISSTDTLVNGVFVQPNETTVVHVNEDADDDRIENTDIWPPGSHLEIVIDGETIREDVDEDGEVERVKIVSENGLADATEEIE